MAKGLAGGVVCALVLSVGIGAVLMAQAPPPAPPPAPKGRINPMIARLEGGGIADGEVLSFIDMEHNPYLIGDLRKMLDDVAAQKSPDGKLLKAPIVRVPMYGSEPSAWAALQVMDLGAMGVVFQSIENRASAERVVASMRFPPQKGSTVSPVPRGTRSGAPRGGKTLVLSADELLKRADVWPLNPDGELMAIPMIETAEAVKNIDQILAVPGIGAILVGSYDLSLSFGDGPPKTGPKPYAADTEGAIQKIAQGCTRHKVVCGIAAGGGKEYRDQLIKWGYRMFLN
jgi:4-hydroxy-2-oxoheptanedioate aldolase